ncbi:MAG TPA: MFS transporter [Chloroflexota bacterium]|jgi:MFS family permease|nr:MFS transporter [Chloroflexota bacterium]
MPDRAAAGLPWRLIATVMTGTLLNPLNSSMISVALLGAAADLQVDIPTATWLVSSFYLVGATGMPLAGRLADLYGPRRIFRGGLLIVLLASVLAAQAPTFGALLVWRVVQAFGSAAPSPAGQAMFRAESGSARPPTHALGALSIANNVSAALGPVIGGLVVSFGGWPAIFWINVPVSLAGLVMAWCWLPPDNRADKRPDSHGHSSARAAIPLTPSLILRELDLPGVGFFALTVVGLLAFLLSVARAPEWLLLGVAVLAGVALVRRELGHPRPFLDIRFLARNPRLVRVYLSFAAVSLVFYGAFFGLPLWLQQTRHFEAATVGLVVLPISGVAVLLTPVAARMIVRYGIRPTLLVGGLALLTGVLLQLWLDVATPLPTLIGITAVIGIASAFNNLGLQAALYQYAPAQWMGTASGQFQTFRYIGATLCTALLGFVFAGTATTDGLHILALALGPIAVLVILASLRIDRP